MADLPQIANTVYSGPTAGGPAVPTFRSLVAADLTVLPANTTTINAFGTNSGGNETGTNLSRSSHGHRLPLSSMLKWLTD